MAESSPPRSSPAARSLVRNPGLVVAGAYEREVAASLERVWENVHDWAHLPWLHAEAFASIEKQAAGAWGWHARVGFHGGAKAEIELVVDLEALRYVARTLSGAGAPGEIWTALEPLDDERTGIRVEFCVPPAPAAKLDRIGQSSVALYRRLWDQDEEMMQQRTRALREREAARVRSCDREELHLGPWQDLQPRLPLVVDLAGARYRLIEVAGSLVVHSAVCPHLLGPLDEAEVESGIVVCPWHGYRFDVRDGCSADGRGLRLRSPPRVEIDSGRGDVRLIVEDTSV
jgi:nitrite reductase/ring-hydroxylating ferredoxin subunit